MPKFGSKTQRQNPDQLGDVQLSESNAEDALNAVLAGHVLLLCHDAI